MAGGIILSNEDCFSWCAQQYVHVNHADLALMLIAGTVLLAGLIFRMVWERIDNHPFSDEWAERIFNACYNIGLFMIIAYLVYYTWYYEPKAVADIAHNMTIFP
jgi:hypothetical protein